MTSYDTQSEQSETMRDRGTNMSNYREKQPWQSTKTQVTSNGDKHRAGMLCSKDICLTGILLLIWVFSFLMFYLYFIGSFTCLVCLCAHTWDWTQGLYVVGTHFTTEPHPQPSLKAKQQWFEIYLVICILEQYLTSKAWRIKWDSILSLTCFAILA